MRTARDITGYRFERLTVTGLSCKRGAKYYWNCLCDCGRRAEISRSELVTGKTRSCGCLKGAKIKDLVGRKFGRLTVLTKFDMSPSGYRWLCQCDCGNERIIIGGNLNSGHTRSCGCLMREKNGRLNHPLCKVYTGMIDRCGNPNNPSFHHYGGRGVRVCNRWIVKNGFLQFVEDMGDRPSPKHSLDRRDVDGDYEPLNCRWATQKEQMRNTRVNRYLTMNGESKTVAEWSDELGIRSNTIFTRLKRGWSDERALSPINRGRS